MSTKSNEELRKINKKSVNESVQNALNSFSDNTKSRIVEITAKTVIAEKRTPLPPNAMVFQLAASLCSANLNGVANRILMHFIAEVGYENFIGIDQKTIADKLNISLRSVTRGLAELSEINVLQSIDHPTDKRRKDYFINPAMMWKGNSFTRKERIKKLSLEDKNQTNLFNQPQSELNIDFYNKKENVKLSENTNFLNETNK
jgi:hypothetical protein